MTTTFSSLGLTTQTPLQKEELKKINALIISLWDNSDSIEFRQPVDYKAFGLLDYPQIIKKPMDLDTVKKNLKNNKYKLVEDILNDMQLIWDNCKTYNAEGSWIYKQAEKMEKYMRKAIKNFLPSIPFNSNDIAKNLPKTGKETSSTNINPENTAAKPIEGSNDYEEEEGISYSDKLKLSNNLKSLTQEQLGEVVNIIIEDCSDAYKEVEKDKCQIFIDNLNRETFDKLNQLIDNWISIPKETLTKKVKVN